MVVIIVMNKPLRAMNEPTFLPLLPSVARLFFSKERKLNDVHILAFKLIYA